MTERGRILSGGKRAGNREARAILFCGVQKKRGKNREFLIFIAVHRTCDRGKGDRKETNKKREEEEIGAEESVERRGRSD